MKKKFTRVLSLILAMVLLFSALPTFSFTASAASGYTHLFPVKNGRLAYYFGYTPEYGGNHTGIDIHSNGDDIIYAAKAGRVDRATNNCTHVNWRRVGGGTDCGHYNEFGNYIRVANEDGTYSYYGHLKHNSLMVKKGDYVYQGQPLAYMGSSGCSSGKHLHYEVRVNGQKINTNPAPGTGNYQYANGVMTYTFSGYGGIKEATVTTNSATNITNTTATVSGNIVDGTATSWGFYLGTSKTNMKKYGTSSSASMDVRTYTVNTLGELKAGTKYYYQMYAVVGGKEKKASDIKSFTTTKKLPSLPRPSVSYKDIAIGDSITASWSETSNAAYYRAYLYDADGFVIEESNNITGCSVAFAGREEAGTYYIAVEAFNNAGSSGASDKQKITVHPNVTVRFIDGTGYYSGGTEYLLCDDQVIGYGKSAVAPVPMDKQDRGLDFSHWEGSYENVTEDVVIKSMYKKKTYTVRFFDHNGNMIGAPITVEHGDTVTAPEFTPTETGYKLAGWDKELTITADTDITASIDWYNANYTIFAEIDSAVRIVDGEDATNEGYQIDVTITNHDLATTRGRVVVALKNSAGKMLTTVESAAFSIPKSGEKTMDVFVPYDGYATTAEVYIVDQYSSFVPIAETVEATIDQNQAWSDWSTDVPPADAYATESRTEYRYKTKSTTTSYSTSKSGWTQVGSEWVKSDSGTIDYVPSWPSCFLTSHSLYTAYNNTPVTAYTNSTTKRTVSTSTLGYIYWHYCRNNQSLGLNHNRSFEYYWTSTYHTFHAFYSTTAKSFNSAADAFNYPMASACQDSYWWGSMGSGNGNLLTVYRCSYTDYKKLFTYEKTSEFTEWSTSAPPSNAVEVESRTVYRYKSNDVVETENTEEVVTFAHNSLISSEYIGRNITLVVYKGDTISQDNIVFIDHNILFEGYHDEYAYFYFSGIMREQPTVESGDFHGAVFIEGVSEPVIYHSYDFDAPTQYFTIQVCNKEGNIIDEQVVPEYTFEIELPSDEEMQVEGYRFMGWDESPYNIYDGLVFHPIYEKNEYTVVFVDWTTRYISMQKFLHGDVLITPELGAVDAHQTIAWDQPAGTIVTGDMIVTAVIEDRMVSADIVGFDGEVVENQDVKYDTALMLPELEEDNYIFLGWRVKNRNDDESAYMTDSVIDSNVVVYPEYIFAETVATPYSDVEDGEYSETQTVTLGCDTEDAVIYYTTDGTDPATSETAIEYTEPFMLDSSCQLRYIAMCLGMNNSDEVSQLLAINTGGTAYHILHIFVSGEGDGRYDALVQDGFRLDVTEFEDLIEGHTFAGFYYDAEMTEEFDASVETIIESTILYADYTPNTYSVVFKDDSGAVVHSELVEYGNAATPPTMAKDGYVFIGWDSEDYLYVTGDITVTAKFVLESEYATVRLNRSKIAIMEGCQYQLKATVKPAALADKEVVWSTDNMSVVTVDNGLITGIAPGTATVTVTVVETGETATCAVTISADTSKHITLNLNSYLDIDSEGYLRRIDAEANTVADVKAQFANDNLSFFDMDGNALLDTDLVSTGTVIKIIDEETVLDEITCIFTGDFNADGLINNRDVVMLNQYVVEKRAADYVQMIAIDVNGDGYVNNRDCSMLSRYLVGKEEL